MPNPICILSSLSWKEGEKKDRGKKERKKERKKEKEREEKEKKREKKKEKKNRIYLESISYLNSDWNLFCALFSKTGVSSSYEIRFGSVSTQIEARGEPHLNSCRSLFNI